MCRGVQKIPVCCQSAGRGSRRLRPRSQAPSSKDEARSSAVWNGSLHFDRALWSLHGPLAGRCTPGVHRERSWRSAKSWVAPGTFRLRRVVACRNSYYESTMRIIKQHNYYVRVGWLRAAAHTPRLLRHITKLRLRPCSYAVLTRTPTRCRTREPRTLKCVIGRASRRYRTASPPPTYTAHHMRNHLRHDCVACGPAHWHCSGAPESAWEAIGDSIIYLTLVHNHAAHAVHARSCLLRLDSEQHGAPPSFLQPPCSPHRIVAREWSIASNSFPHQPVGTLRGSSI